MSKILLIFALLFGTVCFAFGASLFALSFAEGFLAGLTVHMIWRVASAALAAAGLCFLFAALEELVGC